MFSIQSRGKITLFKDPVIMGILNITPDSFYQGHLSESPDAIADRAGRMLAEGAGMLDIGGQSSRPGSERVDAMTETRRILPVIEAILHRYPEALISVDTYHSEVAMAAVNAGAQIVNDISFGEMDPAMIPVVASLGVPYIGMHMKGRPENMQEQAVYEDVTREVLDYVIARSEICRRAGIHDLIIDPGFGFGKTISQNFELLHNLPAFRVTGRPILVGLSRKSTVYRTLGVTPDEALNGSTVLHTIALQQGADILRVHDVKEAEEVVRLLHAYKKAAR